MPRLTPANPLVDFMIAKVRINYAKGGGWTETYKFNTINRQTTQNLLTDLCVWRNLILANGCQIAFASASQQTVLRDSIVPFSLPANPFYLATAGVWGNAIENAGTYELCNNPQSEIYARFNSPSGAWSNHGFRGIRDSWQADDFNIVGGNYLPGALISLNPGFVSSYPAANANYPVMGCSAQTAVLAWCQWLCNNTVFVQPGPSTAGNPVGGTIATYDSFGGARIRTHQVGAGYNQRKSRRKRPLAAAR